MAITQSIGIRGSVGLRGNNAPGDVSIVQERLNALMPKGRPQLQTSGRVGLATIDAILEFQLAVCGFRRADCRVDPDQTTIRRLNDPASEARWQSDPFARTALRADAEAQKFASWLATQPKRIPSHEKAKSDGRLRLKVELALLQAELKRKYPDGRPTALGVLAV